MKELKATGSTTSRVSGAFGSPRPVSFIITTRTDDRLSGSCGCSGAAASNGSSDAFSRSGPHAASIQSSRSRTTPVAPFALADQPVIVAAAPAPSRRTDKPVLERFSSAAGSGVGAAAVCVQPQTEFARRPGTNGVLKAPRNYSHSADHCHHTYSITTSVRTPARADSCSQARGFVCFEQTLLCSYQWLAVRDASDTDSDLVSETLEPSQMQFRATIGATGTTNPTSRCGGWHGAAKAPTWLKSSWTSWKQCSSYF